MVKKPRKSASFTKGPWHFSSPSLSEVARSAEYYMMVIAMLVVVNCMMSLALTFNFEKLPLIRTIHGTRETWDIIFGKSYLHTQVYHLRDWDASWDSAEL